MRGKREQGRIEADRIVVALEHRALEVVVEDNTSHATQRLEAALVPGQKAGHAGVRVKAQPQRSRIAQHHHNAHQRSLGAVNHDVAEVRPVDLAVDSQIAWASAAA
jgi:hypothetical protein